MTKEELIAEIKTAFRDVTLEDGVGLWEARGRDDYADEKTMRELRSRDERNNWQNISYKELSYCYSSLSFFDAKGMRFCLPAFLIFDILSDDLSEDDLNPPDVSFTLSYKLDEEYQAKKFSLLDSRQVQSIIHYLEYKLTRTYEEDEINQAIQVWKRKKTGL